MPKYDFMCQKCETIQEKIVKTDENFQCCECGHLIKYEERLPSAPNLITKSIVGFKNKVPDGFKDKLKEMKKSGGRGSTIDV